MKIFYWLAVLQFLGILNACVPAESGSTTLISHTDGLAQIEFVNRCDHDVVFGRMGAGDFGTIKRGATAVRTLGPDNQQYLALAYYGYKPGAHPGFGNMTLAEFTFNTFHKIDFFDISLVDAYNIGMRINNRGNTCREAICGGDILETCPAAQKIMKDGKVISCSKKGDRDNPNNPSARHFEKRCGNVYSWSGDNEATIGCDAQDYTVTFCPYR